MDMFRSFFGAEQPADKKTVVPPPPGPQNPYQKKSNPAAQSSGNVLPSRPPANGYAASSSQRDPADTPARPSQSDMFSGMEFRKVPAPAHEVNKAVTSNPAPPPKANGFSFAKKSISGTPAVTPKAGGSTPPVSTDLTGSTVAPSSTIASGQPPQPNYLTSSNVPLSSLAAITSGNNNKKKMRSARMPGYARNSGMASSSIVSESDVRDHESLAASTQLTADQSESVVPPPPPNLSRFITPAIPEKRDSSFATNNLKLQQEIIREELEAKSVAAKSVKAESVRAGSVCSLKQESVKTFRTEEQAVDSKDVVDKLQRNVFHLLKEQKSSLQQRAKLHNSCSDVVREASRLRHELKAIEINQNKLCEEEKFEEAEKLDLKLEQTKILLSKQLESITKITNNGGEIDLKILESQKCLADTADGSIKVLMELRGRQSTELNEFIEQGMNSEQKEIEEESGNVEKMRDEISATIKTLDDEQDEVEKSLEEDCLEHIQKRDETVRKQEEVSLEIDALRAQLAEKESELEKLNGVVSGCDVRISSVRSKFENQLKRIANDKIEQESQTEILNVTSEKLALRKVKCQAKIKEIEQTKVICKSKIESTENSIQEAEQWRSSVEACLRRRKFWSDLKIGPRAVKSDAFKKHEAAVLKSAAAKEELAKQEQSGESTKLSIANLEAKLPDLEAEKKAMVSSRSFKMAAKVADQMKQIQEQIAKQKSVLEALDLTALRENVAAARNEEDACRDKLVEIEKGADVEELKILRSEANDLEEIVASWEDAKFDVIDSELLLQNLKLERDLCRLTMDQLAERVGMPSEEVDAMEEIAIPQEVTEIIERRSISVEATPICAEGTTDEENLLNKQQHLQKLDELLEEAVEREDFEQADELDQVIKKLQGEIAILKTKITQSVAAPLKKQPAATSSTKAAPTPPRVSAVAPPPQPPAAVVVVESEEQAVVGAPERIENQNINTIQNVAETGQETENEIVAPKETENETIGQAVEETENGAVEDIVEQVEVAEVAPAVAEEPVVEPVVEPVPEVQGDGNQNRSQLDDGNQTQNGTEALGGGHDSEHGDGWQDDEISISEQVSDQVSHVSELIVQEQVDEISPSHVEVVAPSAEEEQQVQEIAPPPSQNNEAGEDSEPDDQEENISSLHENNQNELDGSLLAQGSLASTQEYQETQNDGGEELSDVVSLPPGSLAGSQHFQGGNLSSDVGGDTPSTLGGGGGAGAVLTNANFEGQDSGLGSPIAHSNRTSEYGGNIMESNDAQELVLQEHLGDVQPNQNTPQNNNNNNNNIQNQQPPNLEDRRESVNPNSSAAVGLPVAPAGLPNVGSSSSLTNNSSNDQHNTTNNNTIIMTADDLEGENGLVNQTPAMSPTAAVNDPPPPPPGAELVLNLNLQPIEPPQAGEIEIDSEDASSNQNGSNVPMQTELAPAVIAQAHQQDELEMEQQQGHHDDDGNGIDPQQVEEETAAAPQLPNMFSGMSIN